MTNLRAPAIRLLVHLEGEMKVDGYPDEPSWGYAFTLLAALEADSRLNDSIASTALVNLLKQDKDSGNYSWEFVVYAWQRAVKLCPDIDSQLVPYGEKGTRMVNWTLLRQLNRINAGVRSWRARLIVRCIRRLYTLPDGQVLDEFKTRSLQYHAFCLFVITEIYLTGKGEGLKSWLINGVKFSLGNSLRDGVALYLGRGQEQIFGYGALIFAGAFAMARWPASFSASDVAIFDKIVNHVLSFQREDGSFPLVLNSDQPEQPNVCFWQDTPHGWFSYNTLYDYQPFLAYCLLRANKFLRGEFV